jgi:hypothetical protein
MRLDPLDYRCMLDTTTLRIIDWLRGIGLTVRFAPLDTSTFLPGVTLEAGGLVVDAERLLYPGDLLHEAGHLAVMLPGRRTSAGADVGTDMGDEIGAQTWSYAAAVHLGLAPEVVFHAQGYKGAAESLIATYANGNAGVPLLQWMGLTWDRKQAAQGAAPFPHMTRWLRGEADPAAFATDDTADH